MDLKKINFGKAAGLVGGAVAAGKISQMVGGAVAQSNVNVSVISPGGRGNEFIKNGLPLVAGLFLSTSKNSILAGAGDGMVAAAGASLVSGLIPGIGSTDVLMGDATEDFSSSSFDTTASGAGEMNY